MVQTFNDDMVAAGIVASLARPDGNITGLSKLTPELSAKRLALLREALPTLSSVGVLWNPDYSAFAADWQRSDCGLCTARRARRSQRSGTS